MLEDARNIKNIQGNLLAAEKEAFAKLLKAVTTQSAFACEHDAQRAGEQLLKDNRQKYHQLRFTIRSEPVYARGRPKAGQPRKISGHRHHIDLRQDEKTEKIAHARELAGCFVLLTNSCNKSSASTSPSTKNPSSGGTKNRPTSPPR